MHHISEEQLNQLRQLCLQLEYRLETALALPEHSTISITGAMLSAEYDHYVQLLRRIITNVQGEV